jgi:hypothetical protein
MQRLSHAVLLLLERSSFASVFVRRVDPQLLPQQPQLVAFDVGDRHPAPPVGRFGGTWSGSLRSPCGRSCSGDRRGQPLRQRTSGGGLGAPPIPTPESARRHRGTSPGRNEHSRANCVPASPTMKPVPGRPPRPPAPDPPHGNEPRRESLSHLARPDAGPNHAPRQPRGERKHEQHGPRRRQ